MRPRSFGSRLSHHVSYQPWRRMPREACANDAERDDDSRKCHPVPAPRAAICARVQVDLYDRSWSMIGKVRMRLPVAAKIAFATAAAIGGGAGSPAPAPTF